LFSREKEFLEFNKDSSVCIFKSFHCALTNFLNSNHTIVDSMDFEDIL